MHTLPLISILVPAYNAENWLADCCASVLKQSYPNVELILIDDGSTDGTYELANDIECSDSRVRVIHTENKGVCCARNAAIDMANGEYIMFLDADDCLINNALERLFSALSKEQADIAIGWKSDITPNGEHIGCPYERDSGVFLGTEGLRLSLEDHPSMYAVWGKLYKRTAIGDIRFMEGKKVHEDSFFVFECLLKQPKIVIIEDIVLHYRLSENSASRCVFSEKLFDILFFAERKKEIIDKEYPEFSVLAKNVTVKANMALLWNLLKTNDLKYKCIEKTAINCVIAEKKYYRTAIRSDAKLFWIVTHRMYSIYKAMFFMKNQLFSQ